MASQLNKLANQPEQIDHHESIEVNVDIVTEAHEAVTGITGHITEKVSVKPASDRSSSTKAKHTATKQHDFSKMSHKQAIFIVEKVINIQVNHLLRQARRNSSYTYFNAHLLAANIRSIRSLKQNLTQLYKLSLEALQELYYRLRNS